MWCFFYPIFRQDHHLKLILAAHLMEEVLIWDGS